MRLLAIITSPLQMQNAIQYIIQHEIDFQQCVLAQVGSSNENDNQRSRAIAAEYNWGLITYFPPFKAFLKRDFTAEEDWLNSELINRESFINSIKSMFQSINNCISTVLLGDYRPMSFRQFLQFTGETNPEIVLLDDGSISRSVMKYRENGDDKDEVLRGFLPHLGEKDPFKFIDSTSITFFSIYDELISQNDKIVFNERYSCSDTLHIKEDEIWICGANHVEARLAKQDEYLNACCTVANWFPEKKIIYFAHRREDKEKIDIIRKLTGAAISEFEYGIEEFVLQKRVKPAQVVVFGSTVADTLSKIFSTDRRIILAVPNEEYFTKAKRTNHVKRVIIENIRKNTGVVAIPVLTKSITEWLNSKRIKKYSEAKNVTLDFPKKIISFSKLKGLEKGENDQEWQRITENRQTKIHRLIFGRFGKSQKNEAYFHSFRLKTEERFAFKIRLADDKKGKDFVEVKADLDVSSFKKSENKFGYIALEIEVDENRISTISVFFKSYKKVSSELQLITLDKSATNTSLHDGVETAGFSLAGIPKFDVKFDLQQTAPFHSIIHVGVKRDRTALLATRLDGRERLFLFHSNLFKNTKITKLHAPLIYDAPISCINCSKPTKNGKAKKDAAGNINLNSILDFSLTIKIERSPYKAFEINNVRNSYGLFDYVKTLEICDVDIRHNKSCIIDIYEGRDSSFQIYH